VKDLLLDFLITGFDEEPAAVRGYTQRGSQDPKLEGAS